MPICGLDLGSTLEATHPEFWFVRNVWGINNDGTYKDVREEFQVQEDFWRRDYPEMNLASLFEEGVTQIYINGFPAGRITYLALLSQLRGFLQQIWSKTDWPFKPPQSLEEMEAFIKLNMQFIATLFQSTKDGIPSIGGTITTLIIPNPLFLQEK